MPKTNATSILATAGRNGMTRRSLMRLAAASLILTGGSSSQKAHAKSTSERTSLFADLPKLDGQLLLDDTARQAMAADNAAPPLPGLQI